MYYHFAVNTKVDMRFNVEKAHWLGERIKERILQTVRKTSVVCTSYLFMLLSYLKMVLDYVVYFSLMYLIIYFSCMYFCIIFHI